jgi:hypothetical protein
LDQPDDKFLNSGNCSTHLFPLVIRFIIARFSWTLLLCFLCGVRFIHAAEPDAGHVSSSSDGWKLRFESTTYVLDLEKQGLGDDTVANGIGRDTTLIGDFATATLNRRLLAQLDFSVGLFTNIPFGYDTVVSQVRPILRFNYRPNDDVSALLGTLRVPHRNFLDAVFDDGNRLVRPIEQGAQITTEFDWYKQDAFINWEQAFGGSATNRFDVGYSGQLRLGPLRFNGQVHWVQNGQALFRLDRSFNTKQNVVSAFGPELIIEPSRYIKVPAWWREIGARFSMLNSYNEPNAGLGPLTRGRGYDSQFWLDLDGWRPRIGFWRGVSFISQQGDPEFSVGNFMELGLSKTISLSENASIELGVQARRITNFVTEQGVKSVAWPNQEYLIFNWNWDRHSEDLLGTIFDRADDAGAEATSRKRFSAMVDTFTYVYNTNYSGLHHINGKPIGNATYAGEYLTPVLRYRPMSNLTLDAGVFVGLPVGTTQTFHTVQPVLSAEWEMLPQVSMVAGTLHRNHPFVDAMFNDATLFSRPVEQGFQLLVNRPHYQQDLFISWNQIETSQKPEQFDLGYAGRLSAGIFGLNGQFYWTHAGGAQFSENRTVQFGGPRLRSAANNTDIAIGPDLTLEPSRYLPALSSVREVEVMALYLTDEDGPIDPTQPITRGRGYFLAAGADIEGWMPYVNFWRGENYKTTRGDPSYFAGNFTEVGFLKDVALPAGFSLRLGGLVRMIDGRATHTEYALLNWSWDQKVWRGSCLRPTLLHRSNQPCAVPN